MNRRQFIKGATAAVFASSVLFFSCDEKKPSTATAANKQTYTCPMHPQIVQDKPGTCPVCGMDLVLFDKSNKDQFLTLDANQQALANISTIAIGTNEFSNSTRLNGRLAINPEQTSFISSRVAGRLEVLYVKETGVPVRKGQPVYKIYSEALSTLQQEYLIAAAQAASFPDDQRFQQLLHGARQKLLLYGQTDAQLKELVSSQRVSPFVTYYAENAGVVAELSVIEGQYVPEGGTIMRLEDYSNIWVEADVYPSEAAKIKSGQQVKVLVAGFEDQPQKMIINFITPSFESGTQIMQIRGSIPNPDNQWQPGLQAIVLLPAASKGKTLTLPVDAVIREGGGSHVWVEREKGIYEPRLVSTGMETSDMVEIKDGLTEGETVVVTGAYLLYSEFVLKKGKNPLAVMKANK
jgi:membrane fusion protein, copper/silver efflux system